MPRLFAALIRHGHFERPADVPSAHSLRPLSAEGREQARGAAGSLHELALELGARVDPRIDSSDLLRAHQTAELLAEALPPLPGGTPRVHGCEALRERSLGAATNLPLAEIEQLLESDPRVPRLPAGWRRMPGFRLPVPGAESQLQAGARAAAAIEASLTELAATAERDTLRAFVAHGGCLRHAALQWGVLALDQVASVGGLGRDGPHRRTAGCPHGQSDG